MFRTRTAFLATLVVGASLALPSLAIAAPAAERRADGVCAGRGPIRAAELTDAVACDLTGRLVVDGDVAVRVPPPGYGVGGSGAGRGGERSLSVTNTAGVVRAEVGTVDPIERGLPPEDTAAQGCRDRSYKLEYGGKPWARTLRWSYHRSSTPAWWSPSAAVTQVKRAAKAMSHGKDACGLTGRPDVTVSYAGTTGTRPSVRGSRSRVACGDLDSANVVGWGQMPDHLEGWTCYWWDADGHMVATDMLLRAGDVLVQGVPQDCVGRLDLRSLATHEWGHALGLDHVGARHSALVMPHLVESCSISDRTLGLGDLLGLEALYGLR